jgi:hypothetical protein
VLHTSQTTIWPNKSSQSATDFTKRCLVAASNGGRSAISKLPKYPRPQLPASNSNSSQRLNRSGPLSYSAAKSKLRYVRRSVGRSVLVSSLILGPRPDLYFCHRVAGVLMWGALSDERTGLSLTFAAGPHQCSHFRVRVPRVPWPYFTVSDSRLPQNWRARSPYISPNYPPRP